MTLGRSSFARMALAAAFIGLLAAAALAREAHALNYVEAPELRNAVKTGVLPPIVDRLPEHPLIVDLGAMGRKPGRHGGEWRMLIHSTKDVKLLTGAGRSELWLMRR